MRILRGSRTDGNMSKAEDLTITYRLVKSGRKTLGMEIRDGQVIVRAPYRVSQTEIDRFVLSHKNWLEKHLIKARQARQEAVKQGRLTVEEIRALGEKALQVIPERVRHYAPLIGVSYGRITIRCQKTRWGSCSSKGNLNFNCLLMLTPPEVIDSVVVHELCHRKEMNHSQAFYAQILRVFPEYHKWDQWLKKNGPAIMKRVY